MDVVIKFKCMQVEDNQPWCHRHQVWLKLRGFGNKDFFQEAKACTTGVRNECKKAKEVGERGTKRGQVAQSFPKKNGV